MSSKTETVSSPNRKSVGRGLCSAKMRSWDINSTSTRGAECGTAAGDWLNCSEKAFSGSLEERFYQNIVPPPTARTIRVYARPFLECGGSCHASRSADNKRGQEEGK